MTLIAVVIGLGAVLIAVVLFLRKPAGDDRAVRDLRGDVLMLRESTEKSMQNANSLFSSQLQAVTQQVQASLASLTDTLGNRLDSINRQVTDQLNQRSNASNASTKPVSERVAAVMSTYAGLQKEV